MLIDTDVLIWATRGYSSVSETLDTIDWPQLSVISQIELLQGARSKKEMAEIEGLLAQWDIGVIALSVAISDQAVSLIRQYAHSHGLQLADALIAATAMLEDLTLFSGNRKHYEAIAGLRFQQFKVG